MIVWCFSPFSPLPEPGAHEGRTAALVKYLQAAGHEVVWFSMDWDHRRKERRGAGSGGRPAKAKRSEDWEPGYGIRPAMAKRSEDWGTGAGLPWRSGAKIGGQGSALSLPPESSLVSQSPCTMPQAPCQIFLIPVPPYSKNISLRRFWSHRIWGNRLVRNAKRMVLDGELAPPDLILASSPPLDAPSAAFRLQRFFGCRVKIDLTDLWPHTFERVFRVPRLRGFTGVRFTARVSETPVPDSQAEKKNPLLSPLYRIAHRQWRKADGISAMSQEYLDDVLRIAPGQDTHLCYIGGKVREGVREQGTGNREIISTTGYREEGNRRANAHIPCAIPHAPCTPPEPSPVPPRRASSCSPSPTNSLPPKATFLYLGALTDSYDFDTLFEAAKILAEEGHDFHIHFAGSGPLEEKLKRESEKLNELANEMPLCGTENGSPSPETSLPVFAPLRLGRPSPVSRLPAFAAKPPPITFHGFLNEADMKALCAQCQVGLNIIRSGLHITMPHKLSDYLCSGLAVINSLPGEAESLLARYHAGLTYPAGDPKALADVMRHYIQDPDIKKAPQSGAMELAENHLKRRATYPQWISWIVQ
jgi:glycosyltransferase involved in cell wall biosynthesis